MKSAKSVTKAMLPTLLCLVTMVLAACGSTGTGTVSAVKAPDAKQVYRWGFTLPDINSFDPGQAPDATSIDAINMVFTGLVQLDDNLQVQPQLAKSYEVSTDGLTYTFHLRPNLKFSDGAKLDANDVAYSIDRSMSKPVNDQSGLASTYLGLIKGQADRSAGKTSTVIGTGIVVKDPDTLQINLSQKGSYFLGALAYPTSYVVEKSVIEKWGNDKWTDHLADNGGQGGDGPFMVKKYDHSTGITFVPNPNYYGPKPQLKEVDYLPFKDGQTAYNAFLAGQIDLVENIATSNYASAKARPGFHSTSTLAVFYLGMNYKVKPLDNVKVRQALSLALNREVINQAAFQGAYIPTCHIVPQGMYGYNANLTCPGGADVKGDAVKAKQLLAEGLQEEGLTSFPEVTLTYRTNSTAVAAEVTTMLQLWKRVLGITINTTTMSQNSMYKAETQTTGKEGPMQMWTAGWAADYPDPQDWISLQFGTGQAYNEFNYGANPGSTVTDQRDLQKQMDAADVMPVTDAAARAAAYNKIEQQLVNDVAWMPLYQRPNLAVLNPHIQGLQFNAFAQFPPNNWTNVYVSQ